MVSRAESAYAACHGHRTQARALPGWLPGWARRAWTEPGGPWRPPARDIAIAAVITVIAVFAAYGEAHPTTPSAYFTNGHHLPHTPTAALLLVVLGGAVLAWRHRYPRLVVAVATAATVAYSLPGYVNGVALLLPAIALVTVATRFPVRQSSAWALAVTVVLMAATAPSNPLGHYGGAFWLIPADNAVALFVGIAIANRHLRALRPRAGRRARPRLTPSAASTRSGCASPASCTTWWRTRWPPSPCRPPRRRSCCATARTRRPSR